MNYLTELAHKYNTDRGLLYNDSPRKGHGYTEVYGNLFDRVRYDIKKVLELGVHKGQGLMMWNDYFPNAEIYGIEKNEANNLHKAPEGPIYTKEDKRIHVMVGELPREEVLTRFINEHGSNFDLIIDDAEHVSDHQQICMGFLFPHLAPGGAYVVEDLHAPYLGAHYIGSVDTIRMAKEYGNSKKIVSQYMTSEQINYIESTIEDQAYYESFPGEAGGQAWIVTKKL